MKAEIKVLHSGPERLSKKGTKYRKVFVLVVIDGNEFLDIRYIYYK